MVLAEIFGGAYLRVGHAGGYVQDMHSNPQYVGVELVGNYTAELSGIVWALAWIMQMTDATPATIHYDCVSAAIVAAGEWKSSKEEKLSTVALTCYRLASQRRALTVKHVKGHSGQPWNEYADRVAAAITSAKTHPLPRPFFCPALVTAARHEATWAVEALGSRFQNDDALPTLRDGKLLVSKGNPATLPPFDYMLDEGATEAQIPGDSQWRRKKKKAYEIEFKLVQCNVLSLDPKCEQEGGVDEDGTTMSAKVSYLDVEMQNLDVTVACFQEARTTGPDTRMLENYICIISGRSAVGAYSCETWMARRVPLKGTDRCVAITPDAVTTLEINERYLYVRVHAPPLRLDIINCHGPHGKHGPAAINKYWQIIEEAIYRHSLPQYPLIIAADVNGRLGSVISPAVDLHQADIEDFPGTMFHNLATNHSLACPSTFEKCHSGPAHTLSKAGNLHCGDYILIPQE